MRILIHSDTHLGYSESNKSTPSDSFVSLAEILHKATSIHQPIDLIINAGDLFDTNNPSKSTLNKTIKIFKHFLLTTSSNQVNNKYKTNVPLVFNDMKVNIKIPYLTINGNHDETGIRSVSPLKLLHNIGVLHYFGRPITSFDEEYNDCDKNVTPNTLYLSDSFSLVKDGANFESTDNTPDMSIDKKDEETIYKPRNGSVFNNFAADNTLSSYKYLKRSLTDEIEYTKSNSNISSDVIKIKPLIFTDYNVAIYGINFMKDDRFLYLLTTNKIHFLSLTSTNFNILIIHQNRIPIGRVAINENLFPKLFNVIIYGHEHEPINFTNNKKQLIIQCGSSVRTSLSQSEVGNKYYYILDVDDRHTISDNNKYNLEIYELETVRPFFFSSLDLRSKTTASTEELVISRITAALTTLTTTKYTINHELLNFLYSIIYEHNTYVGTEIKFLPLIRLRVTMDISVPNLKHKFDSFLSKTANRDILKVSKIPEKQANKILDEVILKMKSKFGNNFYDKMYEYLNEKNLKVIPLRVVGELEKPNLSNLSISNNKVSNMEHIYNNIMGEYLKADYYDLNDIYNTRVRMDRADSGLNNVETNIVAVDKDNLDDNIINPKPDKAADTDYGDKVNNSKDSFDDLLLSDYVDSLSNE
ncbi:Double-strand break repair protein MRE11 [Cucumispora dikerogammari]|nr:Double-strand break repair protein MRE11 [Cucumispora dikerogammari]